MLRILSNLRLFSRNSRRIVFKIPLAGAVTLLDLKGRSLFQVKVSTEEFVSRQGTMCRVLAISVPAGLYIAKFMGKNNHSMSCMVPVM